MATSDFQRYLDEALPKCVLAPEEEDCVKQETAKPKRLIDANALKEKAIPDYESGEMLLYGSMVDEAPTVDAVEVVHGRWIRHGELDEDGNGQYHCSVCSSGENHNPIVDVPYCWKCGAKMDKNENP